MIVEAWGGPHDGRSIEVPDGLAAIEFVEHASADWLAEVRTALNEDPPSPVRRRRRRSIRSSRSALDGSS